MKKLCKWILPCWGIVILCFPTLASEIDGVRLDANGDGLKNSTTIAIPSEPLALDQPDRSTTPDNNQDDCLDMATGIPLEVESPPPSARAHHLGVGAQVLMSSNPYRGGDTVILALPMLTYVGERFFVVSPRAGFHVMKLPRGRINVIADFRFKGEAFEEKGFLAGMDERKNTAMAGLDAHMRVSARWRLESSAVTDILDRHNGQEMNLVLSRVFRQGNLSLIPGAGLVWRSANYNDYYYGVASSEATDERPAYDPGSSLEWIARILLRYDLSANWSLAVAARLEGLSSELRDSPIVDEDYLTTTIVGLNYFF
jgi:outer membrane protein